MAAAVWFAPAPEVRAADETPVGDPTPSALLADAWWRATQMLGEGAPWADAAEQLQDALVVAGAVKMAHRCTGVVTSIELSQSAEDAVARVVDALDEHRTINELIAGLQEARVAHDLVLRPLQQYGVDRRLAWAYLAERRTRGRDAAPYLLFSRGREAIPQLLDALDDQRATRSVAADRSRAVPLVLRVSDISLAIIEAISLCRFHLEPIVHHRRSHRSPLISEWGDARRQDQIALVRDWWEQTRELSSADAVLWRAERAERAEQLQMIDALIATGEHDAALRFLRSRYRHGSELDLDFAKRLLRAGSRVPLEYLHDAVRNGRPVDHDLVSLVVEYGEIDDFKLLRHELMRPCHEGYPVDRAMVVTQLSYCDSLLAIPVLVTVLETHETLGRCDPRAAAPGKKDGVPPYLLRAAERIEALCGRDFGFTHRGSAHAAKRGIEDILKWWRREGKGAYDLEQVRPHAPGGIR